MPDFLKYHKSLSNELHSLKNRIRNLIDDHHWITDGEYKEAALRTVLRRYLPDSLNVGRGFVVTESDSSTQIDILIVNRNKPTVFRDGDLMIVTPDCVEAVVEVKTSLATTCGVRDCATKLAKVGRICRQHEENSPWFGIFSFEGVLRKSDLLLDAAVRAYEQTGVAINSIAYGKDKFVRYWPAGELEQGDHPSCMDYGRWRAYHLKGLASSYFVGNIVDALSGISRPQNAYAWFPLPDGKSAYKEGERRI